MSERGTTELQLVSTPLLGLAAGNGKGAGAFACLMR
jgi:hypothetical protein